MANLFLHVYEHGDRIVVNCNGISGGMRNSQRLLSLRFARPGPMSLEDLLMLSSVRILEWFEGHSPEDDA